MTDPHTLGACSGGAPFDTLRGGEAEYEAARRSAALPVQDRGALPSPDTLRRLRGAGA